MTTNARLRAFVAVADNGSVRAAAQQLCVTESSVSAAVTALSRDVGAGLMEPDGRGVRLTVAGHSYLDYARTILGLHEQARAAARGEVSPHTGLVRLAAVTTAGEHVLPELLASFRGRQPEVALRLEVAPRDAVWRMLAHHEVDLVVAGRPPEGLQGCVQAVRPNTLVVVGAPALAAGFTAETTSWLLREAGSGIRATCLGLLGGLERQPQLLTLGSNGAVVAGAVAGLGVTLVSRDAVSSLCESGRLVELPLPGTPLERPWHVVTHADPTPSTRLLLHHLLADPEGGWLPPSAHSRLGRTLPAAHAV